MNGWRSASMDGSMCMICLEFLEGFILFKITVDPNGITEDLI